MSIGSTAMNNSTTVCTLVSNRNGMKCGHFTAKREMKWVFFSSVWCNDRNVKRLKLLAMPSINSTKTVSLLILVRILHRFAIKEVAVNMNMNKRTQLWLLIVSLFFFSSLSSVNTVVVFVCKTFNFSIELNECDSRRWCNFCFYSTQKTCS